MRAQRDPEDELRQVRAQLKRLTREVERNTRILRLSQERELLLLKAEDLAALLSVMLNDLRTSYRLDARRRCGAGRYVRVSR